MSFRLEEQLEPLPLADVLPGRRSFESRRRRVVAWPPVGIGVDQDHESSNGFRGRVAENDIEAPQERCQPVVRWHLTGGLGDSRIEFENL